LQVSFKKAAAKTLADLGRREQGILDRLDLPAPFADRLMLLGFLPGVAIEAAAAAPAGDPRIYRVDGSEIALREETARSLILR
jgi:ferrous iron transport protein A